MLRGAWRVVPPVVGCLLVLPLAGSPAAAQGDRLAMAQAFKSNRQQLHRYTWKSRTEITVDGKTEQTTLYEARFDSEGKVQKTRIGGEETDGARGPFARKNAKKKRKQQAALSDVLVELIAAYTALGPKQMHLVFSKAIVWRGQVGNEGQTRLQTRDVVRLGDSMDVWVDTVTKRPRKFEIVTSLEGEPVNVTTDFRDLEGGPSYPARIVVDTAIKKKKVVITTENFDYRIAD